jgi:Kef-type K+ transport system membrane component KefB
MVLWLPRLMQAMRVPGVLGFILAGVVLGPGLTGILRSDSQSIELWAELGKLLFMFFVGFEIDLEQFNKARTRAMLFGALTFGLPFAAAVLLGRLLGFSPTGSVLIGSVIASHTLLAHSILARHHLLERESVLVTIGGTIFTDIASMLVLAIVVSVHQTGFSWSLLGTELAELAVYVPLVLFGLSKLARKLIIYFGDSAEARVCILLMVIAIAAELARLIQLEGIVGAFLAGIAVKRALRGRFAIEQLEVLANALFIPTFFLSTGFLIDLPLLGKTLTTRPALAFGLILALVVGKLAAVVLAGRLFGYSSGDKKLMFSITIPQMAATLASAVVGYQTKNSNDERLVDEEFVNAVLVVVVVTCVAGPMLTEYWASRLAAAQTPTDGPNTSAAQGTEIETPS